MKERQSNIELLRLLSMLMIVVFHFNGHSLVTNAPILMAEGLAWNATHTLTITATSVFVLISGYFGIDFKISGVLRLYLRCFVWGLIGYLLYCLFCSNPVSLSTLLGRLLAFTHNKWWFVITYLELYFLSPILNSAIKGFDKRRHLVAIILFGFVTLYMGYCRNTGDDTWGTSLSHFLWLYLIARYIKLYVSIQWIKENRRRWLLGFFVGSAITFSLAIYSDSHSLVLPCLRSYPYCSPWVLMSALSLLLFALSFEFRCRVINWFASSSLSAYLLQDNLYFGFIFLYPTVTAWMMPMALTSRYVWLILVSVVWLCSVCMIDKIFGYILYNPVLSLCERYCKGKIARFIGFDK